MLAVAAAAGCGSEPTAPAPDVKVSFSWLVNGRDPRMADACAESGMEFIRMTLLDGPYGVASTRTVGTLSWNCNLGAWRSTQPELHAGSYRVYWDAVTHEGRVVSTAPATINATTRAVTPAPEPVTLVAGTTYNFDATNAVTLGTDGNPTNFSTGVNGLEVALSYATAAAPTVGSACAAAGVGQIRWQLLGSNGAPVEDHTTSEDCTRFTSVRWDALQRDRYSLKVTGLDASGNIGWQGTCPDLLVTAGPNATRLNCVVTRFAAM